MNTPIEYIVIAVIGGTVLIRLIALYVFSRKDKRKGR